jgi:hypothetical protein
MPRAVFSDFRFQNSDFCEAPWPLRLCVPILFGRIILCLAVVSRGRRATAMKRKISPSTSADSPAHAQGGAPKGRWGPMRELLAGMRERGNESSHFVIRNNRLGRMGARAVAPPPSPSVAGDPIISSWRCFSNFSLSFSLKQGKRFLFVSIPCGSGMAPLRRFHVHRILLPV